jgi:hypothetical protein
MCSYNVFLAHSVTLKCPQSFILLPKRRKTEIIQNIYRYIVKEYKEKKIFLHSKRREYLATGTRGDRIYPPFFQHYEKTIAYRILKLLFTA